MSKKTIAFDIDGTLCSIDSALKRFNEITGKAILYPDMWDYQFQAVYGLSVEDEVKIWTDHTDEIIRTSVPIPKVVQYLKEQKALGHDIAIITARSSKHFDVTKEWFHDYNIPFDRLYMGQTDKYEPIAYEKAIQYLDDKGSLIENLMGTDLKDTCDLTIIDAPHNRKYKSHSRFYI